MEQRRGIFAGDDPLKIAENWLHEAQTAELNDPNAVALSTVDSDGLPNVRVVLIKEISHEGFVFYTNYGSKKAQELDVTGKAAFVFHWKSLRRQIRVRGMVHREEGKKADAYYASRDLRSRIGAWASQQSTVLEGREVLVARAAKLALKLGLKPPRPPFWGGYIVKPVEIEFWADGPARLHDRFRWIRNGENSKWDINRLYP